MVQIVLIRPGATPYDEQGRIQGTLDIPLSPEGSMAASRLSEELQDFKFTLIYTAPYQAAWQTGSILAEVQGCKIKQVPGLTNIDQGLWQGMQVDEVRRKHPKVFRQWQDQPEIICPPEGEMLTDAQERVRLTLTKLLRKCRESTIGLVVPDPLAMLVQSHLTRIPIGELWKLGASCGSWEVITVDLHNLYHRGVKVKEEKNGQTNGALPMGVEEVPFPLH